MLIMQAMQMGGQQQKAYARATKTKGDLMIVGFFENN